MPAPPSGRRWHRRLIAGALPAILLAIPSTAAGAERIWVSPHGSDANPGSKSAPVATPHEAQRRVRRSLRLRPSRGVTVILREGTYRLRKPLKISAADSAAGGRRVTYRAAPGERPVISGGMRVPRSAWSRFDRKADVWRARVGEVHTRELYVDGRRATRAATEEYPAGFRPTWNGGGPGSGIEYIPTDLNPAAWRDPAAWSRPQDVEAMILTQWKTMSVPVSSVVPPASPEPGLLRMEMPGWKNANVYRDSDGRPGPWSFWQVTRFENALEFLDEPGEWYLDEDAGWLYYKPRRGQSMSTARVELPLLQALVRGHGSPARPIRNIAFRGLTFSHATWLEPSGPAGYVSDQAGFHLIGRDHRPNEIGHDPDAAPTPGSVSIRYGRNVRFVENRFRHLGAVGLALGTGSRKALVRRNVFSDVGSSALTLSGISPADHHPTRNGQRSFDNTIAKNVVSEVGWGYPDAPGIFIGFSSGTKVLSNTIENVPWSGIAAGWGWGLLDPGSFPGLPGAVSGEWGEWETPTPNRGSVIARNTISDFLGLLWDGGAIYTTGAQGTSMEDALQIKGNRAYGKRPTAGGNTFYTDGGSRFISVRGNVSYDNPIGEMDFGPPPRKGDPLPYPALLSAIDGLPYGADIGGCRTFGDISYVGNAWLQPPMEAEIDEANEESARLTDGEFVPYSDEGFFSICPYENDGVSYPTNLAYSGNTIQPAGP